MPNLVEEFPVALTARDLTSYDLYLCKEDKSVDGRMSFPNFIASLQSNNQAVNLGSGTFTTTGACSITGTHTTGPLITAAGIAGSFTATAPAQTASAQAGVGVTITASAAVAGSSNAGAAAGGSLTFTAGNAARLTSGNANGGDVIAIPGSLIGSGSDG